MSEENHRILNTMGLYTESLANGETRYFYHNVFTGEIEELTEMGYYQKADRIMKAADTCERICIN